MLKFLLLLLVSTSSFASTLIMTKHLTSGFVSPNNRFVKNCRVYQEGYARISIRRGNGPTVSYTQNISSQNVFLIRSLLQIARRGRIDTIGGTCDSGSNILSGYVRNRKIILDEKIDCGTHKINRSPATRSLKSWASQICRF